MAELTKSDSIGMFVSSLCFVHCLATPFLFVAQTCTRTCCADAPLWWRTIDYVFLAVSFVAIWFSTKGATKQWLKVVLWGNWVILSFFLFFEDLANQHLFERVILIPAITLTLFHFFNKISIRKQNKYEVQCGASCCK
mgnify:CR=1 FL=1|tara:strand:+ start:1577 stop:1990 length:414 start_codon:yes stop_codon:yes gene_type:complete